MDLSKLQGRSSISNNNNSTMGSFFPLHRTQLHPRMHPSSSSSSSTVSVTNKSPHPHHHTRLLILVASLLTLPSLFYLFSTARSVHLSSRFAPPSPHLFALILLSSPTSSRARLFRLLPDSSSPFLLASSSSHSLLDLLLFAKRRVPKRHWPNVAVHLLASPPTDGLPDSDLLESGRQVLRDSGFVFKDEWARVVPEEDKGVYAWVAVNYILGSLGGEPDKTTGVVELGGTSLQVAFASTAVNPVESLKKIKLAGTDYTLQTQSLPQFGQDAVWESLHERINSREMMSSSSFREGHAGNPCIPKGYVASSNLTDVKLLGSHPSGNFAACRHEALTLLKDRQERCLHPPCKIVSSFFSELQGKTDSQQNLFYASEFFGLVPSISLFELEAAGKRYCEDDWEKLKSHHQGINDLDLLRYCFSSAYIVAMAHDGLGVAMDDQRSGFTDHTGSFPFDWTLGAFIFQTMLESSELKSNDFGQIVGNESVTYFSLFVILFVALLAAFIVLQWRKPQFKTIYDLEKGHYIVTRVPR
ncbi:hypothetical protein Tsubulata_012957 [Turnera subulata]|uniref:Apyrase n=1 Tax=Turnera subulata TaxID=218843 RepID=A0A9Q0JAZ4_9ROSI|nr:hypothetical protein Tsubulata_012957 [Turnera subulata]